MHRELIAGHLGGRATTVAGNHTLDVSMPLRFCSGRLRNMVHWKSSAPTKELGTNPGASLCDGCIGKKVIAKLEIITNLVSISKTQSTTYSEGSALHKELT